MTNILIILIAFLVIATLVQILRVGELLSEVRNLDVNKVTEKDNKTQSLIMGSVGILFLASCVWQYFTWGDLMLPGASSEHAVTIDIFVSNGLKISNVMINSTGISTNKAFGPRSQEAKTLTAWGINRMLAYTLSGPSNIASTGHKTLV